MPEEQKIGADVHLSAEEQDTAKRAFIEVFPDLVRKHHACELRGAATECVAALRAGLIALRDESNMARPGSRSDS